MKIVHVLKFGIIGCIGIFIDFFITWLCKDKLKLNKYVANSFGFTFAVVNNYLLNRLYTFHNNNPSIGLQFSKFLLVSIIGFGFSTGLIVLFQKFTRLHFYTCKSIVIGLVFFWNYTANTLLTFST